MLKWEKRRGSSAQEHKKETGNNDDDDDGDKNNGNIVAADKTLIGDFGSQKAQSTQQHHHQQRSISVGPHSAATLPPAASHHQHRQQQQPHYQNVHNTDCYWRNSSHHCPVATTGCSSVVNVPCGIGTIDAQSVCSSNFDVSASTSVAGGAGAQHSHHHHHHHHPLSSSLILVPHSCHKSQQHRELTSSSCTLPMSSPQGAGPIHQGMNSVPNAISAAIAPLPRCCECAAAQNRCSTDSCPCYAMRRMCDERCESVRFRGDCLNQVICQCSCEPDPAKPAKNVCTKSERCDCLRIKESCSKLCACKQICKNKEPTKRAVKVNKPAQGCQCAKGKKQCNKKECQCRGVYEFCSSSCKCGGDCTNGASKFIVPKHVQNCFLEHKHESSGLIVTLIGDDYIYRGDFYHDSKNELHVEEQLGAVIYDLTSKYKFDLYEIVIFVSKSPCFHQECEPKCEIVDDCKSNKACAKLLGFLLSKVRKDLSRVDIRMTVKFLYPHLNRGDLYTKQGILHMLQAGIKVEPLLMKDWSAVMDWSPHSEHKGEYLQLWGNHNLDRAVAQSQAFINDCRRALGLSMKFWVAEIHEIVKNTILHYTEIRGKCNELNDALKQLDLTATPHKIRSTPSKRRSFIDMHELRDKLLMRGGTSTESTGGGTSGGKKNGSSMSVASEDAHAQAMVASFCGRSFDDGETNEIAQRIRKATSSINMEIEALMEFLTHKGAIG